jgi:hypothetical protein
VTALTLGREAHQEMLVWPRWAAAAVTLCVLLLECGCQAGADIGLQRAAVSSAQQQQQRQLTWLLPGRASQPRRLLAARRLPAGPAADNAWLHVPDHLQAARAARSGLELLHAVNASASAAQRAVKALVSGEPTPAQALGLR